MNPTHRRPLVWGMRFFSLITLLLLACSQPVAETSSASGAPEETQTALGLAAIARLIPLHSDLAHPRPGDWLAEHREPGQTFAEYKQADATLPKLPRNKIYIQPIGNFEGRQGQILKDTTEYLGLCYGLPVVMNEPLRTGDLVQVERRGELAQGTLQLLSSDILNKVLKPSLPKDAAAFLALSDVDLWPGHGWNFVFGQASLENRVGVWSLSRNGDPETSEAAYRQCLLRSLKIACHETGHMFSIRHCTAYECLMGGTNSLTETDSKPLWMCPECLQKVLWATPATAVLRLNSQATFCRSRGLEREANFFQECLGAIHQQ
jgi:archaemetzincin